MCRWNEVCGIGEINLIPSYDPAYDFFGSHVSISGTIALIGAWGNKDNGDDSGAAYIFELNEDSNWIQKSKLLPADGAEYDIFGGSVSISGDVAIIGAHGDDANGYDSGAAYIFERQESGEWEEKSKLLPSDGAEDDAFGFSVSISGDVAIVGAKRHDDNGDDSGSAYIFERQESGEWEEKSKLLPSDGFEYEEFGGSVSISGDVAIVGVERDDENGFNSGSAYIFERNGSGAWEERSKLRRSDGAADEWFGGSVSISGDVAIIGAYGDDDNGFNSGSAYIFERQESGEWEEKSKLLPLDGAATDGFGGSVSISGDVAIIGAAQYSAAYIFERDEFGQWEEKYKLRPSDGAEADYFGGSVSISGDVAIIGAGGNDDRGENSGSAYIFEPNESGGWIQNNKLLPQIYDDYSDYSVSISGDFAIVGGAYSFDYHGLSTGAAYVFERNDLGGWILKAILLPQNGEAGNQFGKSVSLSGDVAIVGADRDDDNGESSGSAYIFERDEFGKWIQKSKLLPADGAAADYFGGSVSISGDVAIIGAYGDDANGLDSGAAYIFELNESGGWIQKSKVLASDGAEEDNFGVSVSISGDVAIVGAERDDDNGESSGSAYIFERDEFGNWLQKSKLLPADGAADEWFGGSVSISGDEAIIGAYGDDANGTISGSAYIFERDEFGNWVQKSKLLPADGAEYDNFGSSVSISGDVAIIGAYGDGFHSGSAYIFEQNTSDNWEEKSKLLASDGEASYLFGRSVSISGDFVIIGASSSAYIF